nr:uncharacterized protein LOC115269260 [Aedes albopictus]
MFGTTGTALHVKEPLNESFLIKNDWFLLLVDLMAHQGECFGHDRDKFGWTQTSRWCYRRGRFHSEKLLRKYQPRIHALPRNILCSKSAKAINRPLVHQNAFAVRLQGKTTSDGTRWLLQHVSTHDLIHGAKVLGSDLERSDKMETKRFYIFQGSFSVLNVQTGSKGCREAT